METKKVMERIKRCMEFEDRKDVEFRALISLTELGDIVKYITHDPKLNPGARPHGTQKDEALAYGQAIVQIFATISLRNINLDEAIKLGLKNWEDADWRRREAKKQKELVGIGVVPGGVRGVVYLVSDDNPAHLAPQGSILVTQFAKPELALCIGNVVAIVTDHGGLTCHAANIARERGGVVCVVGTGKATEVLTHGQEIILTVPKEGHGVEVKIESVSKG